MQILKTHFHSEVTTLENKSVKDFNWVRDRMRISFSTNINLFGFQF